MPINYPKLPPIPPIPTAPAPPPPPQFRLPQMTVWGNQFPGQTPPAPAYPEEYAPSDAGNAYDPYGGAPPELPDPTLAEQVPTNATGGPNVGQTASVRDSVFNRLYEIGQGLKSGNPFAAYDPNAMVEEEDPFAWMQPEPEPEPPRQVPAAPAGPIGPPPEQYPIHLRPQQQAKPHPVDRFPRIARFMPGTQANLMANAPRRRGGGGGRAARRGR